jgi:hypothetical protein
MGKDPSESLHLFTYWRLRCLNDNCMYHLSLRVLCVLSGSNLDPEWRVCMHQSIKAWA